MDKLEVYGVSTPYARFNDGTRGLNVGIDSTDSTYSAFFNSSTGHKFLTNNGTLTTMTINVSGNVGIGTTNPSSRFSVNNSASAAGDSLFEVNSSGASGSVYVGTFVNSTESAGTSSTGHALFRIGITGEATKPYLNLNVIRTNSSNGYAEIKTTSGTTTALTNLVLQSSGGNVGIGTTSPNYLLDLRKDQNGGTKLGITNTDTGNLAFSQFGVSALNSTVFIYSQGLNCDTAGGCTSTSQYPAAGGTIEANGTGGLALSTLNASASMRLFTNSNERMRVTAIGNVGIGTTNPANKLDVRGNISFGTAAEQSFTSDGSNGSMRLSAPGGGGIFLQPNNSGVKAAFTNSGTCETGSTYCFSNGNVGIGTTNPSTIAEVSKTSSSYWHPSTGDWGGANLNPSQALTITNTQPNGYDLVIIGRMTTSAGISKPAFAIGALGENNWTDGTLSTQIAGIYFINRDGAGNLVERMRINNQGNIGVGVTAPLANASKFMHIGGATTTEVHLTNTTTTDVAGRGLSLQMWNDNNAYLWNREAGALSFGTNNTEKMRIDASGNVGIGTTSPQQKLEVNGVIRVQNGELNFDQGTQFSGFQIRRSNDASSGNLLAWQVKATESLPIVLGTNNAPRITIDSIGNVGIGTESPNAKLDVRGGVRATGFDFQDASGNQMPNAWIGTATNVDGASNKWLHIGGITDNTDGTGSKRRIGLFADMLYLGGKIGIGQISPNTNLHVVGGNNNDYGQLEVSTSDSDARISLYNSGKNAGNSTSSTRGDINMSASAGYEGMRFMINGLDKMILNGSGNVGIGTTAPGTRLDVQTTDTGGTQAQFISTNTGGGRAGINIAHTSATGGLSIQQLSNGVADIANYSGSEMAFNAKGTGGFYTFHTTDSNNPRLTILNNGNVGIGTTSPSKILHVSGTSSSGGARLEYEGSTQYGSAGIELKNNVSTSNQQIVRLSQGVNDASNTYSAFSIAQFNSAGSWVQTLAQYDEQGNIWDFLTGGNYRMRIDGSGNVGIGTTSPVSRLTVNGDITFPDSGASADPGTTYNIKTPSYWDLVSLQLSRNSKIISAANSIDFRTYSYFYFNVGNASSISAGTAERLRLQDNGNVTMANNGGNVGIGTTSPNQKLEVRGSIRIANTDFAANTTGTFLDTTLGAASGNTYAQLQGYTDGGASPANIALNPVSGKVGIGTTAPEGGLDIQSPLNTGATLVVGGNANGVYPSPTWGGAQSYNFSAGAGEVTYWNTWTPAITSFQFKQKTGASSATTLMTLMPSGNVGISTINS